jgi:hypothetical protein
MLYIELQELCDNFIIIKIYNITYSVKTNVLNKIIVVKYLNFKQYLDDFLKFKFENNLGHIIIMFI